MRPTARGSQDKILEWILVGMVSWNYGSSYGWNEFYSLPQVLMKETALSLCIATEMRCKWFQVVLSCHWDADHVDHLLSSRTSFLYALHVLQAKSTSLLDVYRATVISKVCWQLGLTPVQRQIACDLSCFWIDVKDGASLKKTCLQLLIYLEKPTTHSLNELMTNSTMCYNRSYLRNLICHITPENVDH